MQTLDYVLSIAALHGKSAKVVYSTVRKSSQWDRGFNAQGTGYVANLSSNGVELTEEVSGVNVPLRGSHAWNKDEALKRLAERLESIYG